MASILEVDLENNKTMNDAEIRYNFHKKKLKHQHANKDTRVVDELGLNHGKSRADIAVINGHLIGYEIKSDADSLFRLEEQVHAYTKVFNKAYIIVGDRHKGDINDYVPDWWGIILTSKGPRGAIHFELIRRALNNKHIDLLSIARLLWSDEAREILSLNCDVSPKILRQPRAVLYEYLTSKLNTHVLQKYVREYLKNRKNWRCH